MDDAPEGLSIGVYFSETKPPEVWRMLFRVRPPEEAEGAGDDFDLRRKESQPKDSVGFYWRSGTIGFILALLDCKLDHQESQRFHDFTDLSSSSPAASACGAIGKKGWLQNVFGDVQHMEAAIAKQVFKVKKDPTGRTITFRIDCQRLPPGNIHIFQCNPLPEHIEIKRGKPRPLAESSIRQLYEAIEWKPHHRRKARASSPANKVDSGQLEASHGAIATPVSDDSNVVAGQKEKDLNAAKLKFAGMDALMQEGRIQEAAIECLKAEFLFDRADCVSGVVECRYKMCSIHSRLGWKVEHLDWLLETLKLVKSHGTPTQIVWCLQSLAIRLPHDLDEGSAREFLLKLRLALDVSSDPIAEAPLSSKSTLRLTLIMAATEIGLARGFYNRDEALDQQNLAKSEDMGDMLTPIKCTVKWAERKGPVPQVMMMLYLAAGQAKRRQTTDAFDTIRHAKEVAEKCPESVKGTLLKACEVIHRILGL